MLIFSPHQVWTSLPPSSKPLWEILGMGLEGRVPPSSRSQKIAHVLHEKNLLHQIYTFPYQKCPHQMAPSM